MTEMKLGRQIAHTVEPCVTGKGVGFYYIG